MLTSHHVARDFEILLEASLASTYPMVLTNINMKCTSLVSYAG